MDNFLNQVEKMCHAIGFEPTETRKIKECMNIIETTFVQVEKIKKLGKNSLNQDMLKKHPVQS